ncbi:sulfate permease, SulP family [Haladaptatus litoreus]|uniref:Sulfate permease, SulP family n=1 Tax=Haladaptatus litoreus TaxID=553468 RepID=A0A1N7EAS3_9EURY|nr:SulP family inorganic anion transporter [Haladaptatus litoreus]SIR85045.1 sulfate permease, SulP family [Haladaptatus litoreus]
MRTRYISTERFENGWLGTRFSVPSWESLRSDVPAGIAVALVTIPEAMGYAIIAGINPIYGLYAGMVTTAVGAVFASSRFMIITATNAIALIIADSFGVFDGGIQLHTLFALTLLVGVIQVLLGLFRLGNLLKYVNDEVMTGFIVAVATLLAIDQLDLLVGYEGTLNGSTLVQAGNVIQHAGRWDMATMSVGVGTLLLIIILRRFVTRRYAALVAIAITSGLVFGLGLSSVQIVGDIARIPTTLPVPKPAVPTIDSRLVTSAVAIAIVALVESSGITAAYPNPGESRADQSRNFTAHGVANIVGSLFHAMPGGGSFSRTGVNVEGGAETRWAAVFSGVVLTAIVIFLGNVVEYIPMAGLAGLLVVIGVEIISNEWNDVVQSWRVSKHASAAMIATFLVAVVMSLELAVFVGVGLSLLLYVVTSATDIELERLVPRGYCHFEARSVPDELPSDDVMILYPRGSLYFASVYALADAVPADENATNTILVLRLRGRENLPNTLVNWLEEYIQRLRANGNKLLLSGVSDELMDELERVDLTDKIGAENIFTQEAVLGASTQRALESAYERIA